MTDTPLVATLRIVARVMAEALEPWWIVTSAAVALHRMGAVGSGDACTGVADVDVLLGVEDALRLMPMLGLVAEDRRDHPDFRSTVFATWREPPLPVEFMAGFRHRTGETWRPVAMVTREAMMLGDAALFVPARAELIALLERFDRPKDRARIALLAGAR